jgi:hypothetical protein
MLLLLIARIDMVVLVVVTVEAIVCVIHSKKMHIEYEQDAHEQQHDYGLVFSISGWISSNAVFAFESW